MMNDVVFFCFSISIAIFLLGILVMLPDFLFSPNRFKRKKPLETKDKIEKKKRVNEVESTYRKRHENIGI
ncbi:hypothetical protein ZORO111903_18190 [Zobellia roscoffensis]